MGKGQTIQSWSDTIDTHLVGVFNVIQASLPHLHDGASDAGGFVKAVPWKG